MGLPSHPLALSSMLGLAFFISGIVIRTTQCPNPPFQWMQCQTSLFRLVQPQFQAATDGYVTFTTTAHCNFTDLLMFSCTTEDCLVDNTRLFNSTSPWDCSNQDKMNCHDIPRRNPPSPRCEEAILWIIAGSVLIFLTLVFGWYCYYKSSSDAPSSPPLRSQGEIEDDP